MMDYLHVEGKGKVLALVDQFSRKTTLTYTESANAETAAQAILDFDASFVLPDTFTLVTDNGSHFANELLQELLKKLRGKHLFSIAYQPWTNGAMEVRNRMILK